MHPLIIFIAVIALVIALSMVASQSFPVPRRSTGNTSSFRSKNKEVTFGVDGNLVWYGSVDPNLLQVAGSGALY